MKEEKNYWPNGKIRAHYFYKDGKFHGEYKWYSRHEGGGSDLCSHCFYKDGNDITTTIKEIVSDILAITKEERLLIKLKFGIDCL